MRQLLAAVLSALLWLPLCLKAQDINTYEVAELQVVGCEHTAPAVIRQMSGLRVGDKIQVPGPQLSQAMRRLLGQQLFSAVEIVETQIKAASNSSARKGKKG